MNPPCDQAVIESGRTVAPCAKSARPWILAVDHPRLQHGFHRQHRRQRCSARAFKQTLGGTVIDMQWVVEGYGLFLSALILAGGSHGRSLRPQAHVPARRRPCSPSLRRVAVSPPNIRQLVIARAVQGLGAAFLVPGSLSIISASFGEQERGRAIGTWSGFTAITTAVGPVLGGWLIEHASWRWAFFINAPMAAAVIRAFPFARPGKQSRSAQRRRLGRGADRNRRLGRRRPTDSSNPPPWAGVVPMSGGALAAGSVLLIGFLLLRGSYPLPHGSA